MIPSEPVRFSIVVPTFQRCQLLEQTLQALLRQDYPAECFEIQVVDDGSRDGTAACVEGLRSSSPVPLRYHYQSNQGPAAARNLAIAHCRFPWVAMTDDDCLPDPGWLKAMAEAIGQNPGAVGVEGRTLCPSPHPLGHWVENHRGGCYITANMAYRRDVLQEVGGFDTRFPYPLCEDTELAWRCLARGPIVFWPDALIVHPNREQSLLAQIRQVRYNLSEFYLERKLGGDYARFRRFPKAWLTVGLVLFLMPFRKLWRFRARWAQEPLALAQLFLVSLARIAYFLLVLARPRRARGGVDSGPEKGAA